MTSVDGIELEGSSFAVRSQSLPEGSGDLASLRFVCVDDRGGSPVDGLGLILQSDDLGRLESSVRESAGRRPLVYCPRGDQMALIGMAARMDVPVAISGCAEELLALADVARGTGCRDIVLAPSVTCMKDCLETLVGLGRVTDLPTMVRLGSGEYAMAMATVAVLRGCSLVVLDSLDAASCRTLDELIYSFSYRGRDEGDRDREDERGPVAGTRTRRGSCR